MSAGVRTTATDSVTGLQVENKSTGGGVHVLDGLLNPAGTVKVGNVATPAAAVVTNLFTEVVGAGFTQLVLKFKPLNGYSVGNSPGVYYVVNSADPTTALLVPTTCHYLAVGDEAVHVLPSSAPLTNVDVKAVGTTTATLITWEYK